MSLTAIRTDWTFAMAATFSMAYLTAAAVYDWIMACDEEADIDRLVDKGRYERIRQDSRLAKQFPRLIQAMQRMNGKRFARLRARLREWLVMAGRDYWKAEEFLAVAQLGSLFAAAGVATAVRAFGLLGSVFAVALGFAFLAGSFVNEIFKLKSMAESRVEAIAFRLPYAVDQISLILAAGGHFQEAVGMVLKEMENHALADELRSMHMAIRRGVHRHEALREMADRLKIPVLDEFVSTIVQGENSGTPLAEIIRIQAEQMRLKRSQMIEAFAARMGVRMAFPGILCMISCLIVIAALFAVWAVEILGSEGGLRI